MSLFVNNSILVLINTPSPFRCTYTQLQSLNESLQIMWPSCWLKLASPRLLNEPIFQSLNVFYTSSSNVIFLLLVFHKLFGPNGHSTLKIWFQCLRQFWQSKLTKCQDCTVQVFVRLQACPAFLLHDPNICLVYYAFTFGHLMQLAADMVPHNLTQQNKDYRNKPQTSRSKYIHQNRKVTHHVVPWIH